MQESIDELVQQMAATADEAENDEEVWNHMAPRYVFNVSCSLLLHSVVKTFSDLQWVIGIETYPVEPLNDCNIIFYISCQSFSHVHLPGP